jgi:glyoxylase-like metal-dependent hydrolase (beta-lactamase superfamily II)
MEPVPKLHELNRFIVGWSALHKQWKVEFNSYAVVTPDGVALIDPIRLTDKALKQLESYGEPIAILLTNENHERDSAWFRRRYKIQIYAHEKARPGMEITPDVLFLNREKLPCGLRAIHIPGTTSGETAFYMRQAGGAVFIGDALVNENKKKLAFLPKQYADDPAQSRQSLAKLLELKFKILTVAHGAPILNDAKRQLQKLLRAK